MKKIVLHPWPRLLPNAAPNPKVWPYWGRFVRILRRNLLSRIEGAWEIVQIGEGFDSQLDVDRLALGLPWEDLIEEVRGAAAFVSIDSFLPHMVHALGLKVPGVVVWTVTPPSVFGYPEFQNVTADSPTFTPHPLARMDAVAATIGRVECPPPEKVLAALALALR